MTTTLLRLVADLELSLASQVLAGETSATLNDSEDADGVTLPTGKYGFTIDIGESTKEYIVCDLNGTALTNIISISKQGASSSGFSQYHRAGATVTITDWAILSRMLNNLTGATGFDSATNLGYDDAPTGLTGNQFATVNYVLSVVNGGTVTFDQQVAANQTLGETIAVNEMVYFKEADQRWWKADADVVASYNQVKIGFAKTAGVAGGSAVIAISGVVSGFSGLTPGSKYYLSNTAGGISTSAGTVEVFLGWALSTTTLLFSPREIYMPSALEKAFLTNIYTSLVGAIVPYSGRSAPSGWLDCDGTAVSRTTYANLFAIVAPSQTFTVTIASPGVFSATAHGLVAGDKISLTTTGALPTGLAANTDYYVLSTGLTADAFRVALSPEGTVVNTSGSQSGVHTMYKSAWGKGDGATTFNTPDLRGTFPLGIGQGTKSLAFEPAAVSVGDDWITIPNYNFPIQGQAVVLTTTGTLPAGLSLATTYYVIRLTSTTFGLATSQANANAGTLINITDQGSGVHTMTATGVSQTIIGMKGGEETHALDIGELAAHTHSVNAGGTGGGDGGTGTESASTSGATGGNEQHNTVPPFATVRYIIKT